MLTFDFRLTHFMRNWQFNMLYCIYAYLLPPLVVIYVVQHIYYQYSITQNVNIRLQTELISREIGNLTCCIALICLHQWLFMLFSIFIINILSTQNVNIRLQTNSFQVKLAINLLYCINIPPLAVIYVVQHIYYQYLSTQNVNIRLQTELTSMRNWQFNMLYCINIPPLVVIYVVQHNYYQYSINIEC